MTVRAGGELHDLRERLLDAAISIERVQGEAKGTEHWRLQGKASGVRMALSYVDEALRVSEVPVPRPKQSERDHDSRGRPW